MSDDNKSQHILNTSSNLFGFCFVVFISLRALKISERSIIDECTALSMFLFISSCLLSFLSIRSKTNRSAFYERIADYVFLTGLLTLFITTVFVVFNVIQ
ncbi:hypothetical protein CJD36_017495 [Flavipsychrobacter stenotrophus]|uniref:Uncharacterized protein n=1 Tax=Flavipsychrobacter stenotrophus TaxID=2077091 RepID=A0A2S7SSK2_9BACT|nr:hypothetical protein [Flavipsychrobacter stenotrophus]PQJ09724.1 hypothetical protein CJD36_017495 [Flavipsychrobacter stenotrophus]